MLVLSALVNLSLLLSKKFSRRSCSFATQIFVENNKVRYAGEPIGVILAETRHAALAAAKLVKVEYDVQGKPVIDIPSALARAAKEGKLGTLAKETFESKLKSGLKAPHTIKGEFKVGSQIHMPTEPTICLCIPRDDSMDVHCSTQFVRHVQNAVATALGWSCNAYVSYPRSFNYWR